MARPSSPPMSPAPRTCWSSISSGNGAVVYAKSNTPEFGAGANTFNDVFGRTLNPWNTSRSAAGSSGGAAVALATGMAWLAHGSDMGGSLRNPASFCGVVGLRPSPGRVARSRSAALGGMLSVEGPMARDVEDRGAAARCDGRSRAARSLVAAGGRHEFPRCGAGRSPAPPGGVQPRSRDHAGRARSRADGRGGGGRSSPAPASSSRKRIPISARRMTASRCCGRCPSRPGSRMCSRRMATGSSRRSCGISRRASSFRSRRSSRRSGSGSPCSTARFNSSRPTTCCWRRQRSRRRSRWSSAISPQCNGHSFGNYVEWLAIAYAVTLVACPAISIPAGFTSEELPVGLQIVGPPQGEAAVLRGAKLMQDILDLGAITPIDPRERRR